MSALIRLWLSETRWAELIGGLAMFLWGLGNHVSGHAIPDHTFGATLQWITRAQLELSFSVIGGVQVMMAVYGSRQSRALISVPSLFLNCNIVYGVLFSGLFPYGSVAFFGCTAGMNFLSLCKNQIWPRE